MTNTEILEKIKKVEGIAGLSLKEKLVHSGLVKEYDKAKKRDKEKVKFILQNLQIEKAAIDKIFLFLSIRKFVFFLVLTIANIAFTVFIISVLADCLMDYQIAFWLTAPVVCYFTYYFLKVFKRYFEKSNDFDFLDLIIFTIIIFDILLLAFNIYIWLDLFDGTTKTLFP